MNQKSKQMALFANRFDKVNILKCYRIAKWQNLKHPVAVYVSLKYCFPNKSILTGDIFFIIITHIFVRKMSADGVKQPIIIIMIIIIIIIPTLILIQKTIDNNLIGKHYFVFGHTSNNDTYNQKL
jgi:hypothetical protein